MNWKLEKKFLEKAQKWLFRFIKFNTIGFLVFLVGSAIYSIAFNTFGAWTWLIANGIGGILQFILITYVNKTKSGKIFDSCETKNS